MCRDAKTISAIEPTTGDTQAAPAPCALVAPLLAPKARGILLLATGHASAPQEVSPMCPDRSVTYVPGCTASPGEATQSNIVNCTFAGNWADWDVNQVCPDGQAIVVSSNSTVGIYNSILWWNHNLAQGQCTARLPIAGPAVITYSDVEFGWGGVGSYNISANPLFTAGSPPPTSFVGGSPPPNSVLPLLVLRKASTTARGSQCIDAADYDRLPSDVADLDDDGDYVEVTPLDLLDSSRFVDRHNFGEDPNQGTGSSGVDYTDMGAYERTWP